MQKVLPLSPAGYRNVMKNRLTIVRWILVIPSAFIGWYTALFVGMVLYSVVDSVCANDQMISGMCMAPWSSIVKDGIIIFGASLSAILVLLFSAVVAPSKRKLVAKFIYVGGCAFALYAASETSAWGAFSGAIISGAVFLVLILRYLSGKQYA